MTYRRHFALRFEGLWTHRAFMRLWSAHTVSQFGSQITLLALPLTAVTLLQATPFQMGVLTAMNTLPVLLIGLPAGAWVDRLPKRLILIFTDLARLLLLLMIPGLALMGHLRIEALYVVSFLTGTATLFFELAAQVYLPALIPHDQLMNGNAQLEVSRSAATIAGPSLAGVLAQVMTAPLALLLDALSYLVSALFLACIHQPEPAMHQHENSLWSSIREGMRVFWGSETLRTLYRTVILWNLFVNIVQANFVLFATRSLALSPGELGLVYSVLGAGMLLGASVASALRRRYGVGRVLVGSGFLAASSGLLTVVAGVVGVKSGFWVLLLAQFIFGLGPMIFAINDLTVRQTVIPLHLQGRVNGTYRFGILGMLPIGALLGGFFGQQLGLLAAIGVGACGMFAAVSLLLLSPLPTLREPRRYEDGATNSASTLPETIG